MKDDKCLKYCLIEIEKKLNWENSTTWKETEYIRLAELITTKSGISISPHTLKRLFGKIKYRKNYNPQRATKDALAKFLDFRNWIDFTTYCERNYEDETEYDKPKFLKSKFFKLIFIILSSCFLILIGIIWLNDTQALNSNKKGSSFSFKHSDTLGYVPLTVFVNYNVSKNSSENIYIDFGFIHPVLGPQIMKMDQDRSMYNYTYQIPGYYKVRLSDKHQGFDSTHILAMSQNWDSYLYYEDKLGLWMDNKIKSSKKYNNLYFSRKNLTENGFNTNRVYYLDHRLFKEFNINGDNFEMELKFKNSKDIGGITCYDFVTRLYCEENPMYLSLMERGCSGYSGIKVGSTELIGIKEDLSSLTFDTRKWNILNVLVKDQNVKIFINKDLIYSSYYKGSNGNIVGLEQVFKGSGMLDYIKLKDLETDQIFFDDFK